jgi:hypothetical protein
LPAARGIIHGIKNSRTGKNALFLRNIANGEKVNKKIRIAPEKGKTKIPARVAGIRYKQFI